MIFGTGTPGEGLATTGEGPGPGLTPQQLALAKLQLSNLPPDALAEHLRRLAFASGSDPSRASEFAGGLLKSAPISAALARTGAPGVLGAALQAVDVPGSPTGQSFPTSRGAPPVAGAGGQGYTTDVTNKPSDIAALQLIQSLLRRDPEMFGGLAGGIAGGLATPRAAAPVPEPVVKTPFRPLSQLAEAEGNVPAFTRGANPRSIAQVQAQAGVPSLESIAEHQRVMNRFAEMERTSQRAAQVVPHLKGATLDPVTLRPTTRSGFAVADPATTVPIDGNEELHPQVFRFLSRPDVQEGLAQGRHIGTWIDPETKQGEINLTDLHDDEGSARAAGYARGQKAIGRLEGGEYKGDVNLNEYIAGPALRIAGKTYSVRSPGTHAHVLGQVEQDFYKGVPAFGPEAKAASQRYYDALGQAKPEDEGFIARDSQGNERYVTRQEAGDIHKAGGGKIDRAERLRQAPGELHAYDVSPDPRLALQPHPLADIANDIAKLHGNEEAIRRLTERGLTDAEGARAAVRDAGIQRAQEMGELHSGHLVPPTPEPAKPRGLLGEPMMASVKPSPWDAALSSPLPKGDVTPLATSLAHHIAPDATQESWMRNVRANEPGISRLLDAQPKLADKMFKTALKHQSFVGRLRPFDELQRMASSPEGEAIGPWYRNFLPTLREHGLPERDADVFNRFGSILSAQKSPKDEMLRTLRAFDAWAHDEPITTKKTGTTRARVQQLQRAANDERWGQDAFKTSDYYLLRRGLEGESSALDRHVMRAYTGKDKVTPAQYGVLKGRVLQDARRAGMTTGEWQARIWGGQTGYAAGFGNPGAAPEDWLAYHLASPEFDRLIKRYPGLAELRTQGRHAREVTEGQ